MKGDQRGCSSEWHGPEGHGLKNAHFCDKRNKIYTYLMKRLVTEAERQL